MTYKQIETAREVRLWIGQIVVPVVLGTVTAMSIPEVRHAVIGKVNNIKLSIQNKIKKN